MTYFYYYIRQGERIPDTNALCAHVWDPLPAGRQVSVCRLLYYNFIFRLHLMFIRLRIPDLGMTLAALQLLNRMRNIVALENKAT